MSVCLPTKQPQQVWSSVHLRHRHFWMFSQDLCVLRPLELIEQLSAQHDIEILPDPCYHLVYGVLSVLGVNTQTWQPSQLLELLSEVIRFRVPLRSAALR